ncbi:unnamed protein product [Effrenium voratum]|uniref:Uncharacterized protein n=1 Tax=Effrenium voratum TaxID=2562239 RepID=A0AA36MQH5_9DINO|nr:unnamed protein product [Effrenium voratum]
MEQRYPKLGPALLRCQARVHAAPKSSLCASLQEARARTRGAGVPRSLGVSAYEV